MSGVLASSTRIRVHFVDDSEIQISLSQLFLISDHIISQVIETELIVGAVCYIHRICSLFFIGL